MNDFAFCYKIQAIVEPTYNLRSTLVTTAQFRNATLESIDLHAMASKRTQIFLEALVREGRCEEKHKKNGEKAPFDMIVKHWNHIIDICLENGDGDDLTHPRSYG